MDALKVEIVLLCMDHFVTGRVLDALKTHLMLQRADAEKTQYSLVGKVGQGIYPQGSDKTHRPDDDRMRGLGTWRHTEGVPHACTARGGIVHA